MASCIFAASLVGRTRWVGGGRSISGGEAHGRAPLSTRRRVLPLAGMMGLGLVLAIGSATIMMIANRMEFPGKLIARKPTQIWRHPSPRRLAPRSASIEEASVAFEVENVGENPVRVLSVETSCGCARPTIKPTTVAPHGSASVVVRTTAFPVGENDITIKLRTNSPLTPDLTLRLKTLGWRDPPFLARAAGDLIYPGDASRTGARELYVDTIELRESDPNPPVVNSDLPFLSVAAPIFEEKPYPEGPAIPRRYRYRITLSSPPSQFSGEVVVADPWDPEHTERVRVQGESISYLRAVPSRIVIGGRSETATAPASARLTVYSLGSASGISATVEPGTEAPFSIRRAEFDGEKVASFVVTLGQGGARKAGLYNIILRQSPGSAERVVVPVFVAKGGGQ
jgi:Protein of unknown function (DUF1573)